MIRPAVQFRVTLRSRIAGQAALEVMLIVAWLVLILVLLPDNSIEKLLVAVEGRYQAIVRHAGMP